MPAPIINSLIGFLSGQLNATVFDGEIPRFDPAGNAINPTSSTVPSDWPVIRVFMRDGEAFTREWTTEDAYDDRGRIYLEIYGTSRVQTETLMDQIEAIFAQAGNWKAFSATLGGPSVNPYYAIQFLLQGWASIQEEGARTNLSELLYRCDMIYDCHLHGAISTQ